MRTLILTIGFGLIACMPLQAQEGEARTILEKALKAHGDEKVAQKLQTVIGKGKGTIHVADMVFDMTIQTWTQLPGKVKVVINMSAGGENLEIKQVINGDKGWASLDGTITDLDGDQLKDAKEMMYIDKVCSLFGIKSDKDMKLASLGESKVGDRAVVGIKVTKNKQRDVKLYFDKATGLLAKAEYQAKEPVSQETVMQEKLFGGYKEKIPGFKSATKTTVMNDGKLFMELEITEIRLVDRHDDSVFARPPD